MFSRILYFCSLLFLSTFLASLSKAETIKPELISLGEKYKKGSYRFVKNSQVCETTPGVTTYSGYIDIGKNMSMFFWFFEARHNPQKAPLTLWLNGGPGCSSLIGLFQENGPCTISPDGQSSVLNPYSWNEHSKLISLYQPISTGYSYGLDDVYTTDQAAPRVWDFFQIFFNTKTFSQYKSHDFAFFTESYGGHYGSVFSKYIISKNELIRSGSEKGYPINLSVLGINNGWYDAEIQYKSYYYYAQGKYNKRFDLVDQNTLKKVKAALYNPGGCLSRLGECRRTGKDSDCSEAGAFCGKNVSELALGVQNPYYFVKNNSDTFPSSSYVQFLAKPSIKHAIGAEVKYEECADAPNDQFAEKGDDSRSVLPHLAKVLDSGLRTILWAGADDFICNTLGGYWAVEAIKWKYQKEFNEAPWKQLVIKGETVGIYKAKGPLTYITIFNAGHELAAYRPAVALEVFRQSINHEGIHNVKYL
ncbi:carboxypeptidase S1 [Phakopsora pachyrhizi]|uniref:Carboxypeptidase S1 n=1 Tax=Phakopsora pachyrhizi TaxID=170000 RepID=A0AAV0B9A7_PHAPC|nr:carboxypeptidase S1 [Phakopsora pachyrhizi]CAH7682676.1 carboxypeptidase S1 [Phakopsora pachyrhizi]